MLKEKITENMKQAMREKNKETLATIRLITAGIKNAEIEKRKELSDEEVEAVIQREVKQTKESLEAYRKQAGYEEKVMELENRIKELMEYLPKQMTEEEIKEIITSLMETLNISSKEQKGKLMGVLMPKVKGRADGALVNKIVGELLQ